MKILIAIGVHRQEEAGAAAVVLNHARELERLGHSVDCWFLEDVLTKPTNPQRFEALIFANRVAKLILRDRDKYDVVNLHAPWGCVYGVRRKLGRLVDAPPYVMTMQASESYYARAMRLEHQKGRATNFGRKNRVWHRIYHRSLYGVSIRTADYGAVANQQACAESVRQQKGASGRIRLVPNGVEERFFFDRDYSDGPAARLLYVGTWLDRKGVHYLSEGFGQLIQKKPNVRLTVAGCLTEIDRVKVAFASNARHRVDVIPKIPREDMPILYAKHDVFVFPSLVEGMPLALLEAMAGAMAVVTTEAPGMADIVHDHVNGLLVPPADSKSLSSALETVCDSADLRRYLGSRAQETARQYTWNRVAREMEAVLSLACARDTSVIGATR